MKWDYRLSSACPVCGAFSLAPDGEVSRLLAVCDVLVIKALEMIGKRIIREERARHGQWQAALQPTHLAHTMWQLRDEEVTKALKGAWDVVPALLDQHSGCNDVSAEEVMAMLDDYVHALVITGTAHQIEGLLYCFQEKLDLPVYLKQEAYV